MKRILHGVLFIGFCLVCGFFVFRGIIIHRADRVAAAILEQAGDGTPPQIASNAAKVIYRTFRRGGVYDNVVMGRLRPYLSNDRLPKFIGFPCGAIALVTNEGWCDNAARALAYVLDKKNIRSPQWNMIGPHYAHSALLVEFDDGAALLDPYYGYASVAPDGRHWDPRDIQADIQAGKAGTTDRLYPFDGQANHGFYEHFDTLTMGAQGEPLTISVKLPRLDQPLVIGNLDSDSRDVYGGLTKHGLTITWDYAGHRYDRNWTRELIAAQPVRVAMTLNAEAGDNILAAFDPPPHLTGNRVIAWDLPAGGKIISHDGRAAISWRRMTSYIGIDQIIITPAPDAKETMP